MKDRQILLAGGSGGLGQAAARLLAAEGAQLVVSYRSDAARAEPLQSIAALVQADLTDATQRTALLDAAPELYGIVIFTGNPVRLPDPAEGLTRSFAINATGPILLAREAAERMKARGVAGAIILFGTMQAVSLWPGSTAYASAKAALIHAGRVLAKECRGPSNIRVNIICPGVTDAGMAQASIASGKYERFLREGVIPRYGRADDIARAVRFLLTPDNYITGQVLTIDGGLTL